MENSLDFVRLVQEVVLDPKFSSALPLFFLSLLNELIGVLPFSLVLAGQLFFIEDSIDIAMLAKLLAFVAAPIGVGGAIGVLPLYGLAYFGGKPLIEKYHKFLHFKWEDVEKVSRKFQGRWYDEIIFLFLRIIPVLPSFPATIAAGVLRMRFMPYFVLTAVGFILRMMITLLLIGVGVESLAEIMELIYTE
jgi:membrane protein DedA with SNARE-associated domain